MKNLIIIFIAVFAFACNKDSFDTDVVTGNDTTTLVERGDVDKSLFTGKGYNPCGKLYSSITDYDFDHGSKYGEYANKLVDYINCDYAGKYMCQDLNGFTYTLAFLELEPYLTSAPSGVDRLTIENQLNYINDLKEQIDLTPEPGCNSGSPQFDRVTEAVYSNGYFYLVLRYLCCGQSADF